jgi:hypothetical protein
MLRKEICLSKWWKTASARAAFRRVEIQRKERIAKVREAFAAKQKELADAANNWKEVK